MTQLRLSELLVLLSKETQAEVLAEREKFMESVVDTQNKITEAGVE